MKKKILLIALAVVLVLGCGIGAWLHFRQEDRPDDSGWIPAQTYLRRGSLSGSGYYYEQDVLTYFDFATGNSVALCSKTGCDHNDDTCDGYLGGHHFMAFQNDHLYYMDTDYYGMHLYRRNAIGTDLVKLCDIGTKFVEEQYAVEVKGLAQAGHYLYYAADVVGTVNKDGYSTTESVRCYIGRIHLTTGREEILVERDAGSALLRLIAVRNGSILFRTEGRVDVDYHDPAYAEKNANAPVTLERWDEETGETTELFRKKRTECLSVFMVYGDKVYYPVKLDFTANDRGVTHAFDITTGEETQVAENATYRYLGGGYALRQVGYEEDWHLYDLKTEKALPYTLSEIANSYCVGKSGAVIQYSIKRGDYSGMECCYVSYAAMTDGLQESDLQPVFALMNTHPDTPTNPTTPTQPNDSENEYPPISFDYYPYISDEELDYQIQYLPETVDNPQSLPVLKWVYFTNTRRPFTEDAARELNQMLADRNMPFRVQFMVFTANGSASDMELEWFTRLAAQEALADADLICGYMTPDERQEYLMPITDYVTGGAQPSLKNAVADASCWAGTTTDGVIYGIPSFAASAECGGWRVKAKVFEEYGLTEDDFKKNFWEMDEVFEKIYQANGNKPFLDADYISDDSSISYPSVDDNGDGPDIVLPGDLSWVMDHLYQYIGAYFGIDFSAQTPTVVNTLETDAVRNLWRAVMRYQKAGYIMLQPRGSALVSYGSLDSDSPYKRLYSYGDSTTEFTLIPVTPMTRTIYYSYTHGTFSGIAAVSQNKEEALMLLNLIAEDETFRDQLCFGKEGRDYTLTDGVYTVVRNEDGSGYNMVFLTPLSRFSSIYESEMKRYIHVQDGKTILEAQKENWDQAVRYHYPIAFDFIGFESELEQIEKIIGKYYRFFTNTTDRQIYLPEFGKLELPEMTPELYDQMLQELKDAGSDRIRAELQRQLDEWIANNPDWNK